jgi:hypothetical protein
MKIRDSDRILKEVLATETTQRLRIASLEQGLTLIRRRRQVQAIVRACAVVCLLLVPIAILMTGNPSRTVAPALVSNSTAQPGSPPPLERITDAELLALFPGQTIALVGAPGEQRLMVAGPVTTRN